MEDQVIDNHARAVYLRMQARRWTELALHIMDEVEDGSTQRGLIRSAVSALAEADDLDERNRALTEGSR